MQQQSVCQRGSEPQPPPLSASSPKVTDSQPTAVGSEGGDEQKRSVDQLLVPSSPSASPTQPTDVQESLGNDGNRGGMPASVPGMNQPPPSASLTSVSSNQQPSVTGAATQQSAPTETTAAAVQPPVSVTVQQLPQERVGILNNCMPNNVAAPLIGIDAQVTTTSVHAPGSTSSLHASLHASDSDADSHDIASGKGVPLPQGLKALDTDQFTYSTGTENPLCTCVYFGELIRSGGQSLRRTVDLGPRPDG
eukprot:SAG31_NODE_2404_length_5763_cov_6.902560_5_plen_250_part_00